MNTYLRVESNLGIGSYDEYVQYCKEANTIELNSLRNDKRFFYVQYVREPRRSYVDKGGVAVDERNTATKSPPEGVMVAIEDSKGSLLFGWSARHALRERRPFNKAVALHKALNKARLAYFQGVGVVQTNIPKKLSSSMLEFMVTAANEMEEVRQKRTNGMRDTARRLMCDTPGQVTI